MAAENNVFFLSDYGNCDAFAGVVHAVVRRLAPDARVVDLTHEIPPFDVRAGSAALWRAVPHLGPGVVLGVVDPGVGGTRRGVVVEVAGEPRFFVGPDNGLLVAAAERVGPVVSAHVLARHEGGSATFDGRDLFAPAVAALCRGEAPFSLGASVAADELMALPSMVVERWRDEDGRSVLRAEVAWVDRFGNVQLAAGPEDLPELAELPETDGGGPSLTVGVDRRAVDDAGWTSFPARLVRAFSDLEPGELGVLVDADGRLAVVAPEEPASLRLAVIAGDLLLIRP